MFKVVGLTGKARSGKDTVADMANDLGYSKYALASPIKEGIGAMFGYFFTADEIYGDKKENISEELGVSVRYIAQILGTEFAREYISPDVWLMVADKFVGKCRHSYEKSRNGVVISDVRFPNEAEWVKEHGGVMIRVSRPDLPAVNAHVSEQHEVPVDFEIVNDGSMEDLRVKVRDTFHNIKRNCSYA